MAELEPVAGQDQSSDHIQAETLRDFRQRVQIVFQDPYTSLNPRMTVQRIISEPILVHRLAPRVLSASWSSSSVSPSAAFVTGTLT